MNASLVSGSGSSSTGDRVTLTDLERAFAAAEGRRSAIEQRHAELDRTVGLAKGRIAIKGDIETFLEQIQREAFGRATHSYETMLTALVQDVLPNANPVALELTTERSTPALNISSVGPNGTFEDIFEDHGGALSNVISMGLRLIATIKSGSTRFLALDEPECWVKPDRVPAFFHVLEDSARRLGIQAIWIAGALRTTRGRSTVR